MIPQKTDAFEVREKRRGEYNNGMKKVIKERSVCYDQSISNSFQSLQDRKCGDKKPDLQGAADYGIKPYGWFCIFQAGAVL